ncbi:hypothetical protein M758_12G040500 [Ceratodon purpureus]|nr:hypothetical protein M758_12G040500 [Ceratodon purpureus]
MYVVWNGVEAAMGIRVCALLLLHVVSLCALVLSDDGVIGYVQRGSANGGSEGAEDIWVPVFRRRYFYMHNETQITLARAAAEAVLHKGGGGDELRIRGSGSGLFPDFVAAKDGCSVDSVERDLGFENGRKEVWDTSVRFDGIHFLAVDSCASSCNVGFAGSFTPLEFSSQRWVPPEKPDILIQDVANPLLRFFKVFVEITTNDMPEILADGVYFPATGRMHLVGCVRTVPLDLVFPDGVATPVSSQDVEIRPTFLEDDPDSFHFPPLNSSIPYDCAISATVQYPPLASRPCSPDRVLKYSIRSNRAKDDPLYFKPIKRSAFSSYIECESHMINPNYDLQSQRRIENGGRIVLLLLGILCVALELDHGRDNEESLPFVSLVMLGIQLAYHFSQMSFVKDLQIGGYRGHRYVGFADGSEDSYYGVMTWSEHALYQAMIMVGIVIYIRFFRKVCYRRRIMKVRVVKQLPNAEDPPSDWRVVVASLAIFSFLIVTFLGFVKLRQDQIDQAARSAVRGTMDELVEPDPVSPFDSWRFCEDRFAQWGLVNKVTGLMVSFFLVPQLVGNLLWDFQGRPLSAWFYAGIPFLQSLPHVFLIAKHLQLLPIFTFYDPYLDSMYSVSQDPAPWWPIGIVLGSVVQVLVVHCQLSRTSLTNLLSTAESKIYSPCRQSSINRLTMR